jgi:hypothetical protein
LIDNGVGRRGLQFSSLSHLLVINKEKGIAKHILSLSIFFKKKWKRNKPLCNKLSQRFSMPKCSINPNPCLPIPNFLPSHPICSSRDRPFFLSFFLSILEITNSDRERESIQSTHTHTFLPLHSKYPPSPHTIPDLPRSSIPTDPKYSPC